MVTIDYSASAGAWLIETRNVYLVFIAVFLSGICFAAWRESRS